MATAHCWPHLFVAADPLGLRMLLVPFAPTTEAGLMGRCRSGRARILCDMDPGREEACDCPNIVERACPRIRQAAVRRMAVLHDPENLW